MTILYQTTDSREKFPNDSHIHTHAFQVDIVVRDNGNVHDARMSTRRVNVEKKVYKIDPDNVA